MMGGVLKKAMKSLGLTDFVMPMCGEGNAVIAIKGRVAHIPLPHCGLYELEWSSPDRSFEVPKLTELKMPTVPGVGWKMPVGALSKMHPLSVTVRVQIQGPDRRQIADQEFETGLGN